MTKDLHEPAPQPSEHPAIQPMVVSELLDGPEGLANDINERAAMGLEKYGTLLKPFNGRNALNDLYQEILDAIVYARQAIYEKDFKRDYNAISLESGARLESSYQYLISMASFIRNIKEDEQASPEALSEGSAHLP